MTEISMMTGTPKSWETLYKLREFTRTTGGLHELQVMQLKCWPLVITNATDSTCEFGYDTKTVIFKLSKLKGKKPKDFKKRLKMLAKATQELLGGEYEVLILSDKGKELYRGAQNIISS